MKALNSLLVKLEEQTRAVEQDKTRQVKMYDSLTKEVNDAVKTYIQTKEDPDMSNWLKNQKELYKIYKTLVNK